MVTSQETQAKAQYVGSMFARIARRYDFVNSVMTAGRHGAWRRMALAMADPPEGALGLDVACGTGDFALALARRPVLGVVAADFCQEMLSVAREKASRRGAQDQVHFQMADALSLPFPDDQFHCVTIGFALRNVASIDRCLAELFRVTRPGGRTVSLELTSLGRGPLAPLVHIYLKKAIPMLGGLLTGQREAYRYLPNSVMGFPSPERLAEMMRKAGFSRVWSRQLALGAVAIHVGEK
ncbi:MAG: bifunctional demethylmenaquinone methyltransferase/2-methoxy-6-polyprenyl-1,4-benzoquinol methylase UbiE [Chloroflexi bacterium]|nr:bifunctional demethylmenaquinone methyltransferase/2-methoxy-6-polyprenyl-1,4-benzoquinol methylase UbiE [Chloroflexota bacterium]